MTGRRFLGSILIAFFVMASSSPLLGKKKTRIRIEPGPLVISAAERALVADPEAGIEHFIVLMEEVSVNEDLGTEMQTTYHRRAKILSNEGREFANIELPFRIGDSRLRKWWARVILPDGKVLEIKEDELEKQFLFGGERNEWNTLKTALPGVVPGCIIDYGYEIREAGYTPFRRVELQKEWLVKEFRYRWQPFKYYAAAFSLTNSAQLDIELTRDRDAVLATGSNLPPVPREAYMPPDHQVRAAVILYYLENNTMLNKFWDLSAKRIDREVREFAKKHRSEIKEAAKNIPPGSLPEQVQAAYAWARSESQAGRADERTDKLFVGLLRSLGADAYLVKAVDRTERFWNTGLHSLKQFETSLVAVDLRGEGQTGAILLMDPGSGLPLGQLPWRITGGDGFVATSKGSQSIFLPPSEPKHNLESVEAEIVFLPAGGTMQATWTKSGKGQVGLVEQRAAMTLSGKGRQRFIEGLCTTSGDAEILEAAIPNISDPAQDYSLICDIEMTGVALLDESIGRFHFDASGPWLGRVPYLAPGKRHWPVVFDYPQVQVTRLVIRAPDGFGSGDAPPPRQFESPYGKYSLTLTPTEDGYLMERAFALVPLVVPALEYDALQKFLQDVTEADHAVIVFERVGTQ